MADVGAPEQTGGETWGQIAIPSQMSMWNPGISVIGATAQDTALNAKRAQNLAAFDAYQKMNPGATAADLSAAAGNIFGGSNWLAGNLNAPGVMQALAQKNQMALQATQAVQQKDITAGYQDAMKTAIETADSPEDWVTKTKALLPSTSQGTFDSYMAPKDSAGMFKIYQQMRVAPIVDAGIKAGWDTPDKFTMALGGNASLGQMAYELAKPAVDAAKAKAAADIGLIKGQTSEAYAGATARQAEAGLYGAQTVEARATTAKINQETIAAQNVNRDERLAFFNTAIIGNSFIQDKVAGQDRDLPMAKSYAHDLWVQKYGSDPKSEAEFETNWKDAPLAVAGATSQAQRTASEKAGEIQSQSLIDVPTNTLRSLANNSSKELAYNAVDPFADVKDTAQQTADKDRALSLTKGILDPKNNSGTSDMDAFKRIVAAGVRAGKSDDAIVNDLRAATGATGYPVLADATLLKGAVTQATPGYWATPIGTNPLAAQVIQQTSGTVSRANDLIKSITGGPKGAEGVTIPPAEIKTQVQALSSDISKQQAQIQNQISEIMDPRYTGKYYGPDKASLLSSLREQQRRLSAVAQQVRNVLDAHPELSTTAPYSAPVSVAGQAVAINTNLADADPRTMAVIPEVLDTAHRGVPGLGPSPSQLDQDFIDLVHKSPDWQRLTVATLREVARAYQATQPVAQQGTGFGTYTGTTPGPRVLAPVEVQGIVEQMVGANSAHMTNAEKSLAQKNLALFAQILQAQGTLVPTP